MAECMTMSAPCSKAWMRYGVEKVASTIRGSPRSWATAATASMSRTSMPGLPSVSAKTSRVSAPMAAAKSSGRRGSTKVVEMPKRRNVRLSMLWVPP